MSWPLKVQPIKKSHAGTVPFHSVCTVPQPPPPPDPPLPSSHTTNIVLSSCHPEPPLEILADAQKLKGHNVAKVDSESG